MSRRVYVAIMKAAAAGKGLHLSPDEVIDLSLDDAIATYACNCLTEEELRRKRPNDNIHSFRWEDVKP